MRLVDADTLYEKACDLEAQALDYAVKISHDEEKRDEWLKWSAILAERTAFKYDLQDAPTINLSPCDVCMYGGDIYEPECLKCSAK